jgi:hypothetical protein
VSETGKISDDLADRQADYIILFYIRLLAHMYRQAENLYFIFSCDATAVRVESKTNNLQTAVQPTTFNIV